MEILGLLDIPLWLLLVLTVGLLLYIYGSWTHSTWSSQGVPGPKPWPLLGNILEVQSKSLFYVHTEWKQQYGRTVGYYIGVCPVLSTTDPDMIRNVMVKHFNNFSHRNFSRGLRPPSLEKSLFFSGGKPWKRIRSMMTPAFSTSKLKLMSHYVNPCSDLLASNIENKARSDQLIDVKDVFEAFTMDVVAGTAFGLDTNSQTQEAEPFTKNCKKLFDSSGRSMLFTLVHAFPFLGHVIGYISRTGFGFASNTQFFFDALEKLVDDRRQDTSSKSTRKAIDLLQILVEAEADPEFITDLSENSDDTKSNRRMTTEEVIAQGFIILIAGFETTSTALQYLTYNLTMHPECQEKVVEEMQRELGDEVPTYDNVSKLKYLDACIHETLRMFPPLPFVTREAEEAITIQGIHIPAGGGVTIPIYAIMHDPEYFPDPEVFDPDRNLEENKNQSQTFSLTEELAFGCGPRKCIGMRLALLEIKFAAAQMFRRFRFVKCPETPEKIKLGKNPSLTVPDTAIKVKAEIRSA